jgi:hypothetical protein
MSQPGQSFQQLNKNMYFDSGVEYRRHSQMGTGRV